MNKNFTVGQVSQVDYDHLRAGRYFSMGFSRANRPLTSGQFQREMNLLERLTVHEETGLVTMQYVMEVYGKPHAMGIMHKANVDINIP